MGKHSEGPKGYRNFKRKHTTGPKGRSRRDLLALKDGWLWWVRDGHKFFDILPLRNDIFVPLSAEN